MLEIITFLVLFLVGSAFGSFLNVVIDRLPAKRSFLVGRSLCEHCKKNLKFYDLIPLFSYLILSGKCRYCKAKIPFRLFLVEFLGGITFVVLYHYSLLSGQGLTFFTLSAVIIFSLYAIFLIDVNEGIIPDQILLFLLFVVTLLHVLQAPSTLPEHLITGFMSFALFLAIFILTRGRGMGFGDVKFAFIIGYLTGFPEIIVAFYGAFLTGGFISCLLILAKKKKLRGDTIPFGPFLVLGTLVAYLYGEKIVQIALRYL